MKYFKYPSPHKPFILKIMMAILMLIMLDSCEDIDPFFWLPARYEVYKNLTIYNTSNDSLLFSSFSNGFQDCYPQSRWASIFGYSIIPPHENRTLEGCEDLKSRKTESAYGDSIIVKVFQIVVSKTNSEAFDNYQQYCISYKWYKLDSLRDKDWKLYYPADFK